MACIFNLSFNETAENAIAKAKAAVESQNGTLNGDTTSGDFDVNVFGNNIKGKYFVSGQNLEIEITDKPFFVPCSMIESYLVKQIS